MCCFLLRPEVTTATRKTTVMMMMTKRRSTHALTALLQREEREEEEEEGAKKRRRIEERKKGRWIEPPVAGSTRVERQLTGRAQPSAACVRALLSSSFSCVMRMCFCFVDNLRG